MDSHSSELAASPFDDLFQQLRKRDLPSWWIDSLKAAERAIVLGDPPESLATKIIEVIESSDVDKVDVLRSIGSPDWNDFLERFGASESYRKAVSEIVENRLTGTGLPSWWKEVLAMAEEAIVLDRPPESLAAAIVEKIESDGIDKVKVVRAIGTPDWNQEIKKFGGSKKYTQAVEQEVEALLTGSSSDGSSASDGSSPSEESPSSGTGAKVTGPGTARGTQSASLLGGSGPKIVGALALAGAAAYASRDWLQKKFS